MMMLLESTGCSRSDLAKSSLKDTYAEHLYLANTTFFQSVADLIKKDFQTDTWCSYHPEIETQVIQSGAMPPFLLSHVLYLSGRVWNFKAFLVHLSSGKVALSCESWGRGFSSRCDSVRCECMQLRCSDVLELWRKHSDFRKGSDRESAES